MGVSAHAAEALGDIVFAQLPDPGSSLEVGEVRDQKYFPVPDDECWQECGSLESVKAASEIYSPVSGTVTEKNEEVENGPALINQSPLQDGWMFKWVKTFNFGQF